MLYALGLALALCMCWPSVGADFSDANWTSVGGPVGPNHMVSAVAVDSSGNLWIGGDFTTVGGVAANHIAKWDGTNWSALGSGIDGSVYALAVIGGSVYAGGDFTNASGSAANYIAQWNGNNWSALGSGLNGPVNALAVSGSNLYVGGGFSLAGGAPASNIAQWNGSSWSALSSGVDGSVAALAVSGSNVYAGGYFETAGSTIAERIAKWDGSVWSGVGFTANYIRFNTVYVHALAVSGSNLYAGGTFSPDYGSPGTAMAQWDGSSWTNLSSGMNCFVYALAASGSKVYAGGCFTTAGGIPANYIAQWDGTNWSPLGSGMNDMVTALAVSDSHLYAGGAFTTAGSKAAPFIARAYLPPLPTLSVVQSGSAVQVSWPSANTSGFVLEVADSLASPPSWNPSLAGITDDGINKSVTLPTTEGAQFFRLRRR